MTDEQANAAMRALMGKLMGKNSVPMRLLNPEYVPHILEPAAVAPCWRPISTAPKDGTRILVCRPPQWMPRQIIVSWGEIVGGFGWIPWGASDADFLGWMPIPPPPEATWP